MSVLLLLSIIASIYYVLMQTSNVLKVLTPALDSNEWTIQRCGWTFCLYLRVEVNHLLLRWGGGGFTHCQKYYPVQRSVAAMQENFLVCDNFRCPKSYKTDISDRGGRRRRQNRNLLKL
jgi:hypothetical protein